MAIELGIDGIGPAVLVGAGGSASVFAAERLSDGARVAIKVLKVSAATEKEHKRFAVEQQTLLKLSDHDGIVPILGSGVTDRGEPYFLMPLMESSIQERIDEHGPLEWELAVSVMLGVADAVDFAHQREVLHRDLKPGNVLIDAEFIPRVSDFGIAKLTAATGTTSTSISGTPGYMPPEQFRGEPASELSDVYALGATTMSLITGSIPFVAGEHDTRDAVMLRVLSDEPADLAATTDAPREVAAVVSAAMAKDPVERPSSVSDFRKQLRLAAVAGGATGLDEQATVIVERRELQIPHQAEMRIAQNPHSAVPTHGRRRGLLGAAAALIVAIALLGGLALALSGESPDEIATVDASSAGDSETSRRPEEPGNATGEGDQAGPLGHEADGESNEDAAGSDDATAVESEDGAGESDGETAESESVEPEVGGAVEQAEPESAASPGGRSDDEETEQSTPEEGADPGEGGTEEEPEIPVVADFTASALQVVEGTTVTFSDISRGPVNSRSWQVAGEGRGSGKEMSHRFDTAGTYEIVLSVSGPSTNDSVRRVVEVVAAAQPPVADFDVSQDSVEVGQSISFTNRSSGDVSTVSWDMGDETPTLSGNQVTYSYNEAGTYEVTLTVFGEAGSDSVTRRISVRVPEPPAHAPDFTKISCEFVSASEVTWRWRNLNTNDGYRVEYVGGGDSGFLPNTVSSHTAGRSQVARIVAIKGGVAAATSVGTCEASGGTLSGPPVPAGVTCQVIDIIRNDAGGIVGWSETWSWTDDPSVDFYQVVFNRDGVEQAPVRSSGRNWHTITGVNGVANSGIGMQKIIAVAGDLSSQKGLSPCSNFGGGFGG